jgi:hypothetical protein
MGKELTEEFCKRASITGFIPSFCSKHQKEDQALLWNYQKVYCRQGRTSYPSIFEQKDLMRRVKWKDMDGRRVRAKIERLVEPFKRNI